MERKCKNCGKEIVAASKGMCVTCYKRLEWKPKKKICKRCGRERVLHAKGYCPGCYNFVFHLAKNREETYKKYHNISPELYRKKTQSCIICGFDSVVELHHLDENRANNLEGNLTGICPNHHKMMHHTNFRGEVVSQLKENGFLAL